MKSRRVTNRTEGREEPMKSYQKFVRRLSPVFGPALLIKAPLKGCSQADERLFTIRLDFSCAAERPRPDGLHFPAVRVPKAYAGCR